MDNTNRHFRGQQRNEEVTCFFRSHPIVLLDPIARFFLVFAALTTIEAILVNYGSLKSPVTYLIMVTVMVIFLFFIHRFFLRLLNYFLETVIITNYRLIRLEKTIFLRDDKHTIDLNKIQDVTKQQNGILQTFLDYGSLAIVVNVQETPFIINYVPKPDRYFRRINLVKHAYAIARNPEKLIQNTQDTMQSEQSFTKISL